MCSQVDKRKKKSFSLPLLSITRTTEYTCVWFLLTSSFLLTCSPTLSDEQSERIGGLFLDPPSPLVLRTQFPISKERPKQEHSDKIPRLTRRSRQIERDVARKVEKGSRYGEGGICFAASVQWECRLGSRSAGELQRTEK